LLAFNGEDKETVFGYGRKPRNSTKSSVKIAVKKSSNFALL
jgi:hypothetical protein